MEIPLFIYKIIRRLTAPIEIIVELIPNNSDILDIGCGHGIIAEDLLKTKKNIKYTGVDIKESRIKNLQKRFPFFNFIPENAMNVVKHFANNNERFDCIVISDLLYLFEDSSVESFIKDAYEILKDGGLIIIKDVDRKRLNHLVYIQEYISVKIFKITPSERIFFKSTEFYSEIFNRLEVKYSIINIPKLWYPHFIIIVRK